MAPFFNRSAEDNDALPVPRAYMQRLLIEKFPYFRTLPAPLKEKFLDRTSEFISSKEFSPRKGLLLTDEMKVLVSASAIQVTLGLKQYLFDNFPRIVIYPEQYLSKQTNKYHKGDVNLGGVIALSWHDFREGYDNSVNNRNLGLHEMAHAVRFDKFRGDYDEFFSAYFDKWSRIAKAEFDNVRAENASSIFRDYAGTNMNEFFAVCVEHFFETPGKFRDELPELYRHTCILLNQDPSIPGSVGVRMHLLSRTRRVSNGELLWSTDYAAGPAVVLLIIFIAGILNLFKAEASAQPVIAIVMFSILVPAFIIANQLMQCVIFYKNAVVVRHPVNTIFSPRRVLQHGDLVSAEMRREEQSGRNGNVITYTMSLTFIYKGKIKTYDTEGSCDDLRKTGEYLHGLKVAVKVFHDSLKWT